MSVPGVRPRKPTEGRAAGRRARGWPRRPLSGTASAARESPGGGVPGASYDVSMIRVINSMIMKPEAAGAHSARRLSRDSEGRRGSRTSRLDTVTPEDCRRDSDCQWQPQLTRLKLHWQLAHWQIDLPGT